MRRDGLAGREDWDDLFESVNEVVFADGFFTDVTAMKLPVSAAYANATDGRKGPLSDAATAVVYQWIMQELEFFLGSPRNVVGADAIKVDRGSIWMVSVELIQLMGHQISIIFSFGESAQIVRVLAAMPTVSSRNRLLFTAKISVAEVRLYELRAAELADERIRAKQLFGLSRETIS
jgi:hypothetical protein